jgi:glycine cleavage system H lipoate-binding protein
LRKLNQVEEEMGWLFKMEVKDGARGRNELEK